MSFSRVPLILVGDGANSQTYAGMTTANIAAGDIAVVNRQGAVLAAGATPTSAAGNDYIQIIQGTATGRSKKSRQIQARNITGYSVSSAVAATQQVVTVGSNATTGSITAVNSATYKLTINLRTSANILPNQQAKYFFFYTASSAATQDEIATALVTKINADKNASVLFTAAKLTETANRGITITGKAVPTDSFGINKSEFVTFDVHFMYTTELSITPVLAASSITTTTAPVMGKGTYQQVLDMWKDYIYYEGYTNWTQFPVASLPSDGPVVGATYDIVTIDHFDEHAGDIQNAHKSPSRIHLAIATGSTQLAAVVAVLDPYIAALGVDKK